MSYETRLNQNNENLQNILNTVNSLPDASDGVELPTLDNPGTSADLLSGKQFIDQNGNIVTGEFSLDSELEVQGQLISDIQTALEDFDGGSSGGANIATCNVTLTSNNGWYTGYLFTVLNNGEIDVVNTLMVGNSISTPIIINNVLCNSACLLGSSYSLPGFSITNGTMDGEGMSGGGKSFKLVAANGANVTINQYNND